MACFSLYLPGRQGADPGHLTSLGLQELQSDWGPEFADVLGNGPDGGNGLLVAWRTQDPQTDPLLTVDKSRQKWLPMPAGKTRKAGEVWIGHEPDRPPTPACLRRRGRLCGGKDVKLNDGNWWHVPEVFALPHVLGLNMDGTFTKHVNSEFQELNERAGQYAVLICEQIGQIDLLRQARPDVKIGDIAVDFPITDAWSYAVAALTCNYRITIEVADHLRLFSEHHVIRVLSATIGLEDILEVVDQKKSEPTISIPVGSATNSG